MRLPGLRSALLVEDDLERTVWFGEHKPNDMTVQNTWTVPMAVRALEAGAFDELWLDHDLGTEPLTGRDVALWLVQHPENNPQIFTRTHTVNVVSGPKIVRDLLAARRQAVWIPFDLLVRNGIEA